VADVLSLPVATEKSLHNFGSKGCLQLGSLASWSLLLSFSQSQNLPVRVLQKCHGRKYFVYEVALEWTDISKFPPGAKFGRNNAVSGRSGSLSIFTCLTASANTNLRGTSFVGAEVDPEAARSPVSSHITQIFIYLSSACLSMKMDK
jgi:hypothetical protein